MEQWAFIVGSSASILRFDSALARTLLYTTTRLGVYKTVVEKVKKSNSIEGKGKSTLNLAELSFFQKLYCAGFAGFVGSMVGNPADLALVRVQADTILKDSERRNYKNVFDAIKRIGKDEGILALWRGATPTIVRGIAMNLAMLSSYDEVKERAMRYMDSGETFQIRL